MKEHFLKNQTYGQAIRSGFEYLLENHKNVFAFGQGLWSPWYVGNSMTELEKQFGKERVIDSPVSELACTGAAIGASLCGYRPIVIHPRMDFMLLAMDQIINQAAKWRSMLGGQVSPAVTIRGIINRGGEQGAQHSQSLHSLFAHIPGLRVVMPSTVQDARDLLISSVLCDDPVVYIDDRWLYEREETLFFYDEHAIKTLSHQGPVLRREGTDITLVGAGFSAYQCELIAEELIKNHILSDVIDLRVINPLDVNLVQKSVKKTGRLCVIDGSWKNCGLAGEVISAVLEKIPLHHLKNNPLRITLPEAPAPCSRALEQNYYSDVKKMTLKIREKMGNVHAVTPV
ncbi:MAG: alpha-ketoacid dehydrogenase subunit beta [Gammaproteobacteria bacterium]|nr:alpha-ketoacid dehydrogenase subunit beta [Gammaproteobacteria bacterium]